MLEPVALPWNREAIPDGKSELHSMAILIAIVAMATPGSARA